MRILKYIFLLILLASIALSVYIATQNSKFDIQRSKVISIDQPTLFSYIDEYKNWEDWGPWKQDDPTLQYVYPEKTKGVGASYSWSGKEGDGNMTTVRTFENDSIIQKISFDNGKPSDIIWGFEKVNGGTKITWRMKGEMNFMMKAFSLFKGGAENMMGPMFEKGLNNIDTILVKELESHSVKVNGLVRKNGVYYIKQSLICKISSLSKNMKIMMTNLSNFATKNNITVNGSPFAIYNKYDEQNGIVSFSVCLPVKEQIFTSEGSDISGSKFGSYLALKTTLTGDYSHLRKAWDKSYEALKEHNWQENKSGKYIEVYKVGPKDKNRPSEWVTEIYIPIIEKNQPISQQIDSTKVTL